MSAYMTRDELVQAILEHAPDDSLFGLCHLRVAGGLIALFPASNRSGAVKAEHWKFERPKMCAIPDCDE